MDERRAKSARNGFVVASVLLLFAFTFEYVQQGSWSVLGTVFFVTQVAYWGSWLYYRVG